MYHVNAPSQLTDFQFTKEQLIKRDVPDLSSEQHASAAQIYFLIAWQLHDRFGTPDVNLTSQSENPRDNVGPVDRFLNIDGSIGNSGEGTSRIVKYENALKSIPSFFGWLLVELRYGWKAVCQGKDFFRKKQTRPGAA